ncbi:MAG: DUF4230 domain-containing protein [Acidimicrobiia bacterium]|nr:DUF4230 domain-containing protein [Acidimicrobiia bacterium]
MDYATISGSFMVVTEPVTGSRPARWPWVLAAILAAVLIGVVGVVLAFRSLIDRIPTTDDVAEALAPEPYENIGPTVVQSIRSLANLTTVEYVEYTIIEKGTDGGILAWARGDSLTLLAVARIGAGIDLSEMTVDSFKVDQESGVVTVTLPAVEIQYIAVDNEATQVIDRTTGLFTRGDPRLETDARQVAETTLLQQAESAGILTEAERNAVNVLTNFLLGLGYTQVDIITSTAPA